MAEAAKPARRVARGFKRVRWTQAKREAFLNALAETCNIMASAEAAGVKSQNVYELKRKDEAFAEQWRHALACGYEVLETRLVGLALTPLGADQAAKGGPRALDNGPHGRIDTDLALRMLTQHRGAMAGKVRGGGAAPRRATREETDEAILRKIEMIERARKAGVA